MSYQEISYSRVKARKVYKCSWCGQDILKDELHDSRFYKFDGDIRSSREHIECTVKMQDDAKSSGGSDFEYYPYVNERGVK